MLKKLDGYIIKTFFGPFLFIFSVLFFIFIVQFAWTEMDQFLGKGLSAWTVLKLLFYLGISMVQVVLPLTILLASIMTFGGLGERYELAAMKSTGISLWRIMMPLFGMVCIMAFGLFVFLDQVVPMTQRKAKNMIYNIAKSKPALQFIEGAFTSNIPNMSMKVGQISGEEGELLKNVFIHFKSTGYDDQKSIISKSGKFAPTKDQRFLKLELYNGYYYNDEVANKQQTDLIRQKNQVIKFDTLQQYFDISEIIEKAIESESITDNYKFLTTKGLSKRIDTLRKQDALTFANLQKSSNENLIYELQKIKKGKLNPQAIKPLWDLTKLPKTQQKSITKAAIDDVNNTLTIQKSNEEQIATLIKTHAKHVLQMHRNFSYPFICIVFFLIGAPLGAIIRKGGIGMPVLMAIIIFVFFYIISYACESMALIGTQNPVISAWIADILFFPLGILFTYKAMTDSAIYNPENYLKPFKKIIQKFKKTEKEHVRYQ